MQKRGNNFAFIDSQNVYASIKSNGWKLDWRRFYIYLQEKYAIKRAYIFLGYIKENEQLYQFFRSCGYTIIFKPVVFADKRIKGNVDAELVLQAMIDIQDYNQAIIVTGDGDFYCLVKYLLKQNKLKKILVPNKFRYSHLFDRVFSQQEKKHYLAAMDDLKQKISYKTKQPR